MKNLYVGNLPHSTTESELRNLFAAHGAVEKVSIVTDRETGRARGFEAALDALAVVAAVVAVDAAAAVDATIIRAMPVNLASRAGKIVFRT